MNKFELEPIVQEILYLKYVEVIMNKLYKEELLTTKEHEELINYCKKEINKHVKKMEGLNDKTYKD